MSPEELEASMEPRRLFADPPVLEYIVESTNEIGEVCGVHELSIAPEDVYKFTNALSRIIGREVTEQECLESMNKLLVFVDLCLAFEARKRYNNAVDAVQ